MRRASVRIARKEEKNRRRYVTGESRDMTSRQTQVKRAPDRDACRPEARNRITVEIDCRCILPAVPRFQQKCSSAYGRRYWRRVPGTPSLYSTPLVETQFPCTGFRSECAARRVSFLCAVFVSSPAYTRIGRVGTRVLQES